MSRHYYPITSDLYRAIQLSHQCSGQLKSLAEGLWWPSKKPFPAALLNIRCKFEAQTFRQKNNHQKTRLYFRCHGHTRKAATESLSQGMLGYALVRQTPKSPTSTNTQTNGLRKHCPTKPLSLSRSLALSLFTLFPPFPPVNISPTSLWRGRARW